MRKARHGRNGWWWKMPVTQGGGGPVWDTNTKSWDYGGGDEQAVAPNASFADYDSTDTFAVAFRCKYTGTPFASYISKLDPSSVYEGWELNRGGATIPLEFQLNTDAYAGNRLKVDWRTGEAANLNDGNWHYVLVCKTPGTAGNTVRAWVDGVLQTINITTESLSGSASSPVPLCIAGRTSENFFDIGLDEIYLYEGLNFSDAQAAALADPDVDPTTLDSWAYAVAALRMGDPPDSTSTIEDRKNSNDFTPQNAESGDIVSDVAA